MFDVTASLTMIYNPPFTNTPSDINLSVTSGVTAWYDMNIGGTYTFVEIYRNEPVYKVRPKIIDINTCKHFIFSVME